MTAKKPWTLMQAIAAKTTEEDFAAAAKFDLAYARCVERLKSKAAWLPIEKRDRKMRRGFAALRRKFGHWPPTSDSAPNVSSKNPRAGGFMTGLRTGAIELRGLRDSIVGPQVIVAASEFNAEWEFQPLACNGAGLARRVPSRSIKELTIYFCELEPPRNPGAKRGKKVQYDWPKVEGEAYRLLEENGDFILNDRTWVQADLERALADFMLKEFKVAPSESYLRDKAKSFHASWLKHKAAN